VPEWPKSRSRACPAIRRAGKLSGVAFERHGWDTYALRAAGEAEPSGIRSHRSHSDHAKGLSSTSRTFICPPGMKYRKFAEVKLPVVLPGSFPASM